MGRKIFVSYKYADNTVYPLNGDDSTTVRDYVDYLQDIKFSGDDVNKGEHDGEDLSQFKDETIRTKLKDKIFDSSITILLISQKMKNPEKLEDDQWIPWEISYSLREQSRNGYTSHANAIIAVVLPDKLNSYDYYIQKNILTKKPDGEKINTTSFNSDITFKIVTDNMFNEKFPSTIETFEGNTVYFGDCSYIKVVRWEDFIENTDEILENAIDIQNNIDRYNIYKTIEGKHE